MASAAAAQFTACSSKRSALPERNPAVLLAISLKVGPRYTPRPDRAGPATTTDKPPIVARTVAPESAPPTGYSIELLIGTLLGRPVVIGCAVALTVSVP